MSRAVGIGLCVLFLAAVGVVVVAARTMRESRDELERQFAQGELVRAEEVGRGLEEDLNEIGDHLRFLGPLLSSTESVSDCTRELRALLEVALQIRHALVLDEAQALVLELASSSSGPLDEALRRELIHWAPPVGRPGPFRIATSGRMSADASVWLRAFAAPFGDEQTRRRGTVVLLVDMGKLARLGGLRAGAPSARALVLDPAGAPSPASDPALAKAALAAPRDSAMRRLVEQLRAAGRDVVAISAAEAAQLGLPRWDAIAAHVPAAPRDAEPWAVATVQSTAQLRIHERAVFVRLGLATAGVAVGLMAFAGYLVWASRRALALRERLRHADALAHLHEKNEKVLDTIPAIVVTLSDAGRITALNQRARERIPLTAMGQGLAAAFPEAPAAIVAELDELTAVARREGVVQSLFGQRVALFGEEGSYSLHAVPLEARFPEARVVLVLEDLSQVRSLETQLLRAEKLATVGVLAAGIAHEIGTPLSVVRGRAEYIGGKLGEGHPQHPGLEVIVGEIERVVRTVRQLLDFSRVRPAQVSQVALGPLVRGVGDLLGFEGQRRGVALTLDVSDELPPLLADADRLKQVLINLVMNSYDACRQGGRVRLSAALQAGTSPVLRRMKITVTDDGAGVPEEMRLAVFDPFYTTKKRGQGTGLGLAICSEIVREHGAEIELTAAAEGGTVVTVTWPVAESGRSPRGAA